MSLKKSATRRLSLLAGSSLIAASLTALAFTGAVLAPTAALAADECGATDGNPATDDQITCVPGNYSATGITYPTTDGDLDITVDFASQPYVSFGFIPNGTAPVALNVGANGFDVTATGGDSLSLEFETGSTEVLFDDGSGIPVGPITGGATVSGTGGSTINFRTASGDIDITTWRVTATGANSRAVNAESTAGGDVTVTTLGAISATGTGAIGIRAVSTGGDVMVSSSAAVTGGITASTTGAGDVTIAAAGAKTASTVSGDILITGGGNATATSTGGGDITITGNVIDASTTGGNIAITSAIAAGTARGIRAVTSGAGGVDMTLSGNITANNTTGVAAVDVTAGTGGVDITYNGTGNIHGGAGYAIQATSTGGADIDVLTGRLGSINTNRPIRGGAVNFAGVSAGGVRLTFAGASSSSGRWLADRHSVFSPGDDVLSMNGVGINLLDDIAGAGASFDFGAGNDTWNLGAFFSASSTAVIDFGAGEDTFNVSGVLAYDGFAILNLEALNNSGVIFLGAGREGNGVTEDFTKSNGLADDVLSLPGATFTGSGDSRIVLDAILGGGTQAGCETLTGFADCLDLRDGSTAGSTSLIVNYVGNDALQGSFGSLTVVDVSGAGTSGADHFTLGASSTGYFEHPLYGGVMDRPGLFVYGLIYDPDAQRHELVGLPRSEAMEYAILPSVAQTIWHMTTETVTDRQGDLRAAREGEREGAPRWIRTTGEYTKRDVVTDLDVGAGFAFDDSYKLYAGTIMGGLDLIQGRSGGLDYVVGAQIGYVGSSFELNASPSTGRMTGATGGVYGSIWNERAFLDATFNMNGLTLDYESPGLGSKTNTYTTAFGARLEGGMRWMLTEVLFAEPLATLAFTRTGFEEISLSGGEVRPADSQSRRGALGLRLGGDVDGQIVNWSYFVTGRAWNEFDGESEGVVNNPGADVPFADEFSGAFGEFEAGLSLHNEANTLSGFLASGVKAKDGYSAVNLSLGLRMAW